MITVVVWLLRLTLTRIFFWRRKCSSHCLRPEELMPWNISDKNFHNANYHCSKRLSMLCSPEIVLARGLPTWAEWLLCSWQSAYVNAWPTDSFLFPAGHLHEFQANSCLLGFCLSRRNSFPPEIYAICLTCCSNNTSFRHRTSPNNIVFFLRLSKSLSCHVSKLMFCSMLCPRASLTLLQLWFCFVLASGRDIQNRFRHC